MSCTHMTCRAGRAPLWHLAICGDCRRSRRADAIIGFALTCRKAETAPASVLANTLASLDLPSSMLRPRRGRLKILMGRAKWPVVVLVPAAAALAFGYARYIDIDPNIVIPARVYQGQNAYDDFQRAYSLLKDKELISKMLKPRKLQTMARDNKGLTEDDGLGTERTSVLIGGGTLGASSMFGAGANTTHKYALSEKEDFLHRNFAALTEIRQGLLRQYWVPSSVPDESIRDIEGRMSFLNRLLRLDAEIAEERKDWKRVVTRGLDIVELGTKLQSTTGMEGKVTGIVHERIGRSILWKAIDRLSAADARAAARRLETVAGAKPPTADALRDEKRFQIARTQDWMRRTHWRFEFGDDNNLNSKLLAYIELLPYSKTRFIRIVEENMDAAIAQTQAPPKPADSTWQDSRNYPPLLNAVLPAYPNTRSLDDLDDTKNRLLAACFALRAYRLEHGGYPETLAGLTTGYLRSVPIDPFAGQMPLRYLRKEQRYLMYGIGPDCTDNGGVPYVRHIDNSGDIVAGINAE